MSFLIPVDFWSVYHVALSDYGGEWLRHPGITTQLWSILGVFIIFANENIARTSPQMVLSIRSMVFSPSPRLCLSFLLLIGICGAQGRERVRHTCIVYIAKSNNGSIGEKCHTLRSRCVSVTPRPIDSTGEFENLSDEVEELCYSSLFRIYATPIWS